MADSFKISCNAAEIAEKLGADFEEVQSKLQKSMEELSVYTHAFIVDKANTELAHNDYLRNAFLGTGKVEHNLSSDQNPKLTSPDAKNLRWNRIGNNMWVVELDESVEYIDQGRPRTSMATADWLLKPNRSKTAKDGSTYRSIPMPAGQASSHPQESTMGTAMFLKESLKKAARSQGVKLNKIEYDNMGKPKMGVLHRIDTSKFEAAGRSRAGAFSKPRTPSEAAATGLKAHEGHFMVAGAAVIQKPANNKQGVTRETVVFRTVSSKHQNEDRWMAPEIKGIKAIEAGHKWAEDQWNDMLKTIEDEFNNKNNR